MKEDGDLLWLECSASTLSLSKLHTTSPHPIFCTVSLFIISVVHLAVFRQEEEARSRRDHWEVSTAGVMENLKDFAKRRTDIFGSGDVETEIGRRVGMTGREGGVRLALPRIINPLTG